MAHGFLNDANGNKSSKRLFGSIILSTALILCLVLFGYSMITGAKDAQTAMSVINMLLLMGCSLLGIGVFENKNINKKGTKQPDILN